MTDQEIIDLMDFNKLSRLELYNGMYVTRNEATGEVLVRDSDHIPYNRMLRYSSQAKDPFVAFCEAEGILKIRWGAYYYDDETHTDYNHSQVEYKDGRVDSHLLDLDYTTDAGRIFESLKYQNGETGVFEFSLDDLMIRKIAELEMLEPELQECPLFESTVTKYAGAELVSGRWRLQ